MLGLGSPSAALSWADQLLADLEAGGAPVQVTPQTQQFLYDWQLSEGTGGQNNPVNVGPEAGLSTSGSQFGGGAANYPSPAAAAQATADYLLGPGASQYGYTGIVSGLEAGSYQQASQALIDSSWASGHYGGGSAWSQAPVPGSASAATASLSVSPAPTTTAASSASSSAPASSTPASAGAQLGASAVSGISGLLAKVQAWFTTPRLIAFAVAVVVLYMGWSTTFQGGPTASA